MCKLKNLVSEMLISEFDQHCQLIKRICNAEQELSKTAEILEDNGFPFHLQCSPFNSELEIVDNLGVYEMSNKEAEIAFDATQKKLSQLLGEIPKILNGELFVSARWQKARLHYIVGLNPDERT